MKPNNNNLTVNSNNSFFYKELFSKSFSIMLLINPETGKIIEANDAACRFYGYSHKEITELKISDINTLSEAEVKKEIENAKSAKRNYFNFKHKLANGKIKDVEVYSNLIKHENKEVLFSVMHDVTEKKELSKKYRESEDKFNSVFNSYLHPAHMIDKEFNIVSVNKKLLELKGLKKEEIIGKFINLCKAGTEDTTIGTSAKIIVLAQAIKDIGGVKLSKDLNYDGAIGTSVVDKYDADGDGDTTDSVNEERDTTVGIYDPMFDEIISSMRMIGIIELNPSTNKWELKRYLYTE